MDIDTFQSSEGPYIARGSELLFRSWGGTDLGRVRKENEDFALNDPIHGFFIVADGMGGGVRGGEASRMAVESIRSSLLNSMDLLREFSNTPTKSNYQNIQQSIHQAILAAHGHIRDLASSLVKGSYMGTTITCLIICGKIGVVAHVGDSRLYRIRDNEVKQLTRDHSLVAERLRRGEITPEEAQHAPGKNVLLQALGVSKRIELDIGFVTLRPGDQFLLCTDGLHNNLIRDEIVTIFQEKDGNRIIPRLIDCANQRGGRDNITALAIRVSSPWDGLAETQLDMGHELFSSLRILKGLSLPDSSAFLRMGTLKHFIASEILVEEEKNWEGLMVVLEGRAKVTRQSIWLGTYSNGNFFGEAALFQEEAKSPVTISCEEEGLRVLQFSPDNFRTFVTEKPLLASQVLWNLSKELTLAQKDLLMRLGESIRIQKKN